MNELVVLALPVAVLFLIMKALPGRRYDEQSAQGMSALPRRLRLRGQAVWRYPPGRFELAVVAVESGTIAAVPPIDMPASDWSSTPIPFDLLIENAVEIGRGPFCELAAQLDGFGILDGAHEVEGEMSTTTMFSLPEPLLRRDWSSSKVTSST